MSGSRSSRYQVILFCDYTLRGSRIKYVPALSQALPQALWQFPNLHCFEQSVDLGSRLEWLHTTGASDTSIPRVSRTRCHNKTLVDTLY